MTTQGQAGRSDDEKGSEEIAHAKRATLIRRLVMLVIFGGAIGLGLLTELPVWDSLKKGQVEKVDEEEEKKIREAMEAENQLTILNTMIDGNADSEKLKEILERLKQEKYHDQIEPVDLHVEKHKNIADEQEIDLEEFAGQLDFYAGGQKLGTLMDETDPVVVETTIDRYLEGLIKRFGPSWLPSVGGMTRRAQPAATPSPRPAQPTGVPGMQTRGASGVPGMRRASQGEQNIQVEPADQ